MRRIKHKNILVLFLMCLALVFNSAPIFATNNTQNEKLDDVNDKADFTDKTDLSKGSDKNEHVTQMLEQMFTKDLYESATGLQAGIGMAKPFVYLIYVFCIFLIVVVAYFFCGVTLVDLAFIIIPPIRVMLLKRTQSMGGPTSSSTGGADNFCCVSDSCLQAVYGSSSPGGGSGMSYGMMGSGGTSDRGVSSCLSRYASSRSKEFVVFIIFALFFMTGMLGKLSVVLFNIFGSLIEGVLNLM